MTSFQKLGMMRIVKWRFGYTFISWEAIRDLQRNGLT